MKYKKMKNKKIIDNAGIKKLSVFKKISLLVIVIGFIALISNFIFLIQIYKGDFFKLVKNPSISVLFLFIIIIAVSFFYENRFFKSIHIIIFFLTSVLALFSKSESPIGTEYIYSIILFIFTYLIALKYGFLKRKFVVKTFIYIVIILLANYFKAYQLTGDLKMSLGVSLTPMLFIIFSIFFVSVLYYDEIKDIISKKKQLQKYILENIQFINIGKNYSYLIHNMKNDLNTIYSTIKIMQIQINNFNKKNENNNSSILEKLKQYLGIQEKYLQNIIFKMNTNREIINHKKRLDFEKIEVNKIIKNVISSFKELNDLILDVQINFESDFEKIYLKIIPAFFVQIIENIVLNAIEAINPDYNREKNLKLNDANFDKNTISYNSLSMDQKTDVNKHNKKFIIIKSSITGNYVCVTIANNGPSIEFCKGCNFNKKSCLNCPYFTSEYTSKEYGTGQGMNFVVNTLKKLNGNLIVNTDKELTSFKLYFKNN